MYVIQYMVLETDRYTILLFTRLQCQSIALDTVMPVDIDMEKDIDMQRPYQKVIVIPQWHQLSKLLGQGAFNKAGLYPAWQEAVSLGHVVEAAQCPNNLSMYTSANHGQNPLLHDTI